MSRWGNKTSREDVLTFSINIKDVLLKFTTIYYTYEKRTPIMKNPLQAPYCEKLTTSPVGSANCENS